MHDKAMTTLAGPGAFEFWIVDAETRTVLVHREASGMRLYRADEAVPLPMFGSQIVLSQLFVGSNRRPSDQTEHSGPLSSPSSEAAHAFQADPWQRTWISSSWPAYWIWICLTDDPETQTTVSTHQVPHLKSAVDETGLQRPDSDRSEPTGDPITPVAASGDCWCDVDPDGWLFR